MVDGLRNDKIYELYELDGGKKGRHHVLDIYTLIYIRHDRKVYNRSLHTRTSLRLPRYTLSDAAEVILGSESWIGHKIQITDEKQQ